MGKKKRCLPKVIKLLTSFFCETVCPECYYECPQKCGFIIQCKLSKAQCEHSCVAILKSQITQLHAQNEELKTENAILSSGGSEHKKRGNWLEKWLTERS